MNKGYSSSNSFKSDTKGEGQNLKISPVSNKKNIVSVQTTFVLPHRLNHSNNGEYRKNGKQHLSGGHGQDAIDYMNKNGIKYEINRVYNNGVRIGNVLDSKFNNQKHGNNHSWFPEEWTKTEIDNAAKHVYLNQKVKKDGKYSAAYKNVRTTIIVKGGEIVTVYPNKYQKGGWKK